MASESSGKKYIAGRPDLIHPVLNHEDLVNLVSPMHE